MKPTLLALLVIFRAAMSQQARPVSNEDHEIIQQLLKRVEYLEAQLSDLRAQRAAGTGSPEGPVKSAGAAAIAEAQAKPASASPGQSSAPTHDMMSHEVPNGMPAMRIRGFGHIEHAVDNRKGNTNSFSLGQFTLFLTSKLSERVSVLAEATIESGESFGPRPVIINNRFDIELQRLLLQYSVNDYLTLSFGRYHSAIGFYNTSYHHSAWLQTATGRPAIFAFEDQGGILPIHNVGVEASGRIPSGQLGLRYMAEIGNGRASRSLLAEPVQNVKDENNGKSFNLAILARPVWMPGFQAGFSLHRDRLTPEAQPRTGETIMAAHVVWQTPNWELLNEALLIRHAQPGRVARTPAFYIQGSRLFGKMRPYLRYQYLNAPGSDPVLSDVGLLHGPSAGIRYNFSGFAAFKIQYDHMERRRAPAITGLTTQISFTF